jgi:N-acetylmuramoyl-L-alanine amidase
MLRAYWLVKVTLVLVLLFYVQTASASSIRDARLSEQGENVRLVLELVDEPEYTYFSLKNPQRLVVDLKGVLPKQKLNKFDLTSSLIKKVRYSTPKTKSDTRLVIELSRDATPTLFKLAPTGSGGPRLVIDLLDSQPPEPASVVLDDSVTDNRDIIVAIDAGHGGKDPGSVGPAGTYEKRITLSVAKLLRGRVDATSGMQAELIRSGDYYIHPNRRPEIARQKKADLFVSIHADAFRRPEPRGASVWVLSMGRADNELGRWLEKTERHSELLGGAAQVITDKASERYLAETILGLSMDHSMASSYDLSELVIDEIRDITKMHKSKPQAASFAVLTSPDIPSILVELGFISNPQEEKNLNWAKYRQRLADAIFTAIKAYFRQTPPDGTLWASQKKSVRTHKVRSGESLSLLAQRYNVPVKTIKAANNLSSDTVRVGQLLEIPST